MGAKKTANGRVLQADALRVAIQNRVESAGSLREVAKEAGVSHAVLSRFLAGAGLRASTHAELSKWLDAQEPNRLLRLRAELARVLAPLSPAEARRIETGVIRMIDEALDHPKTPKQS